MTSYDANGAPVEAQTGTVRRYIGLVHTLTSSDGLIPLADAEPVGVVLASAHDAAIAAKDAEIRTLRNTLRHQDVEIAASREAVSAGDAAIQRLSEQLADARRECEGLRQWIADLHSGMYINCVYCGHRYGPATTTPDSKADMLKAHIEVCPQHPMSALKAALAAAKRECEGLTQDVASWKLTAQRLDDKLAAERERCARMEAVLSRIDAPPDFHQYVVNNIPPGTIIIEPSWWAHRLWRQAARAALAPAGEGKKP